MNTKKKRLDLMLDIETLGTGNDSIILSFAFKSFCLPGLENCVDEEYQLCYTISSFSSILFGRTFDKSTVDWWIRDDNKMALYDMSSNQCKLAVPLDYVMIDLYKWLNNMEALYDVYYWGRGASSFDLPILSSSMKAVIGKEYTEPWKFWKVMDVRSIINFGKMTGLQLDDRGHKKHQALCDVERQIDEVTQAYAFAKRSEPTI